MAGDSLLDRLNRDGFVVVPAALPPSQLAALRAAAHDVTALARAGHWPHVRTLPKQFPPWPQNSPAVARDHGIWGVQGLMHPDLPHSAEFVAVYFSDAVVGPTRELLRECAGGGGGGPGKNGRTNGNDGGGGVGEKGVDGEEDGKGEEGEEEEEEEEEDDDLVMELFNLLVRPDTDFELRWHRDDIPATATPDEETARLAQPAFHAQWNLPLYDDASLLVVPGSHARPRTPAERAAGPFEAALPGQVVVALRAGDVVFYDNNILHRGRYDAATERMTLHGSVGHVGGEGVRARNVLQHGVGGWVDRVDFGRLEGRRRRRAERMRGNLVRMGRAAGEVGYSLDG